MTAVYVAGVAMTRFGRQPQRSVKDMTREAVTAALCDAGCDAHTPGMAFFANCTQDLIEGQTAVAGQIALRAAGLARVPVVNVENACASGTAAFQLACTHVRARVSDVALAVGCERMSAADKHKVFSLLAGGWDVHEADAIAERLGRLGAGVEPPPAVATGGPKSVFMEVYAAFARDHMHTDGLTERQLAVVAAKNHCHASMNPRAQYRQDMTVEEVLGARVVAWPLTLPMCAPVSDGAAAVVVCNARGLARLGATRAVGVLACVAGEGMDRAWGDLDAHITRRASNRAYEDAGLGPRDVSLAEVHDATAFGEILQTECLGLCPIGAGGELAGSGATRLGGAIPINVSGGLESRGHPVGATGLAQIHELVTQLRGEAGARQVPLARIGLAQNGGGFHGVEEAAAYVTILGR
ncbi:MAG: thiolase family protein [Gammaproteobacteria bacterium]|nr:thiolase family protein [Gammaproteobacteria bacterium]